MKKYFPFLIAAFALLVIFSPQKKALAYSTTVVPTYYQGNSIFVDHTGDLNIQWQKVQLGFGGYSLPSGYALMVVINATTTLPVINTLVDHGTTGSPCASNIAPIYEAPLMSWNVGVGCSQETYAGGNTNPYGNNDSGNTIWDGSTGSYVAANTITAVTPVYIVLVSNLTASTPTCGGSGCHDFYVVGTPTYLDAIKTFPNFITASLGAIITTPPANNNGPDFPDWLVSMSNTATSTATGTIQITYTLANASATVVGVDSSTFMIQGSSNTNIQILKTQPLYYPQAQGVLQYTAYLNLSTAVESYPTSTVNFGITGTTGSGPCDQPESVVLTTPYASSTITNNFPNWNVATPNLLEGCTYTLQVLMSPQIGSITGTTDQAAISVTPTFNPSTVSVLKQKNVWNYWNATTTAINYTVLLLNQADGITVGSDQGTFYLGYSATSSAATIPPGFNPGDQCGGVCQGFGTIGGGSIATPSSTIANNGNDCRPAADWTDIGGGIAYGFCSTINYLFVPGDGAKAILQNDQNILESVPPFSWFFQTNAEIAAIANGDTSYITPGGAAVYHINPAVSSTPSNGVAMTIMTGINGATSTFTLLPANPMTGFLADGRLIDDWYNLILTAFVCIVIIMMYKIIL